MKLGPDEYWLMGDNRRGSHDSRWIGPIGRKFIHGRILWRLWSFDRPDNWSVLRLPIRLPIIGDTLDFAIIDLIRHPIDFWRHMRWGRFLQVPRGEGERVALRASTA